MRSLRLGCLLSCALIAGCASEGGVTGTGISASVTGNIAVVSDAPEVAAELPFPIRVSLAEVPSIAGTTDAQGAFVLAGTFSGALTLEFTNAATGAPVGPLVIDVPPGSATVLENIEIDFAAPLNQRVRPGAVRQFDVFGRIDMVECDADGSGTLLLLDDGPPVRQRLVRLTPDTDVAASDGEPLACGDLRRGLGVRVEGLLRLVDQTIVALDVVEARRRSAPPPSPVPHAERLRGTVTAVACARGLVEVEQAGALDPVRRIIALGPDTDVRCVADASRSCACSDIEVGDAIVIGGTIEPQRPGMVDAAVVIVGAMLERVTRIGVVVATSCDSGTIDLRDPQAPGRSFAARVSRATAFVCAGARCTCADLRAGDRVRVDGAQAVDSVQPIDADRVTRLPRQRTP